MLVSSYSALYCAGQDAARRRNHLNNAVKVQLERAQGRNVVARTLRFVRPPQSLRTASPSSPRRNSRELEDIREPWRPEVREGLPNVGPTLP